MNIEEITFEDISAHLILKEEIDNESDSLACLVDKFLELGDDEHYGYCHGFKVKK